MNPRQTSIFRVNFPQGVEILPEGWYNNEYDFTFPYGGTDMKKFLKPKYLPELTLVLGVLGCFCSLWVHQNVDDRALLNPMHPGAIILWILTALTIAAAVLLTRPLKGKMRYDRIFPKSIVGAVGTAHAGIGIAVTAYGELTAGTDRIVLICGIVGLAAGLCLLYLAWCRFNGTRPHPLVGSVVLVYLMMHMLCRYRVWSAEPELLRFFFPLAATVCLTLAFYHRTAINVGLSQRNQYLLFAMLGAFFALAALPGSTDRLFLGGMYVWAITDRCTLRVRKPRQKQEEA